MSTASTRVPDARRPPFAQLLRNWRGSRKLSQLELALESRISQRHLSFLESGRARPSREMVLQLADALDIPLRERNLLLTAAGFAAVFRNRSLDDPAMRPVLAAIQLILQHHEPNPVAVVDRDWNLVMQNAAMQRLFALLGDADDVWQRVCGDGARNVMRMTFHPQGLRGQVVNWEEIAPMLIARLRRDAEAGGSEVLHTLLQEVLDYPGLPPSVHRLDPAAPPPPVLSLRLRQGAVELSLFTVISTFGTAQDVTTDELRIESFFPADETSAQLLRLLAAQGGGAPDA
jgi:transcriptional regulator with XRE-family HTH domain